VSISTWAATSGDWDDSKFSRAWNGPYINPAVGSLALSASVPISTSGIMRTVGNASLAFTGQVPISATGYYISVDNGTLTLSAEKPVNPALYVPSGSLTLTGQVPVSKSGVMISPAKGDLTGLSLGETWDSSSSTWATVSGNWDTGTFPPSAGITYTFTIDSAGNLVLTPYEPEWPFVADPTFIPSIFIS
tara:strand:- start:134 stop:703 length:570 start_codon:yes stop_codon:yes gene_type:complete